MHVAARGSVRERQRNDAVGHQLGLRKHAARQAKPLRVIGMQVNRAEVHAGSDALVGERGDQRVAGERRINVDENGIEVTCMDVTGVDRRRTYQWQVGQAACRSIMLYLKPGSTTS